MEPLMFVMAILGCGEGDSACWEIAVAPARYRTEAACLAASEEVLARQDDMRFPTVVAQCRQLGTRPQLLRGSEVRLPEPEFNRLPPQRIAAARRGQAGV